MQKVVEAIADVLETYAVYLNCQGNLASLDLWIE